jgi:peptide/nickel transport system permease protein
LAEAYPKKAGMTLAPAGRTIGGINVRRLRLPLVPTVPLTIIAVITFMAIFAPMFTSYDPIKQSLLDSLTPPSFIEGGDPAHFLGTDNFGRDIWSRLVYGGRISLSVSALVILIGGSLGVVVGTISGYFGGWFDSILMRVVDIILSFPLILIVIVMVTMVGASINNIIILVALLIWPRLARMIRAEAISIRSQDYVTLARISGASHLRIMTRHIIPNVIPTLIVICTLEVGAIILLESSLSFLGVGIPPPNPSWGVMVADGRGQVASGWWISLFPGLAIMIVVLAMNVTGDWLRDKLDPRLQTV